jgi:hypothetical protein
MMSYEHNLPDHADRCDFSDGPIETVADADEEPLWSSPRLLDILVMMTMLAVLCAVPVMCGMDMQEGTGGLFAIALLLFLGSFAFGLVRLIRCGDEKEQERCESEDETQATANE